MQLENLEGWYQLKQFGIFFLGVVVGVVFTIILYFYGCFKSFLIAKPPARNQVDTVPTTTEDVENQLPPPSYSSLRFDKTSCKPCKCCHVVKNIFKK